MKSIILFGGSFDPIHNGHLAIARFALNHLDGEKVIYIPAKNPRWKQASDIKHRLEMLQIALKDEPNCEISTFEMDQNSPVSYSVITAEYFRKIYPNRKLYFIIGYDQLDQLDDWHEIEHMSNLVQIVAFARRGYPKNHEAIKKYHVQVIENIKMPVSSTKIRTLQSLDTKKEVIDYIVDHDLYFCKTVKAYLSEDRYKHSISVARTAYDIAKANNIEPSVAYIAGLLHDIAKNMSKQELHHYMDELFPEYASYPEFTFHQWVGSYITEEFFSITNQNILDAICYHTTGRKIMSTYDKIIYASDKIEPLRGYNSDFLIEACKENLEKGWLLVLKENEKFFEEKHIKYKDIPLSKEMYENYLLEISK